MRTAEWAVEWAAAPVAAEWDMDMVTTVEWGVEVVDDTVEDKTTRTKNLDRRSREPKVLKSSTISKPTHTRTTNDKDNVNNQQLCSPTLDTRPTPP